VDQIIIQTEAAKAAFAAGMQAAREESIDAADMQEPREEITEKQ
jgi:hypothetical protein